MAFCPENNLAKGATHFLSLKPTIQTTQPESKPPVIADQSALHLFEKSSSPAQGPSPVSCAAQDRQREFFCLCFGAPQKAHQNTAFSRAAQATQAVYCLLAAVYFR